MSWNAVEFLRRLDAGEFDDNLSEELKKLVADQLAEVCELMARRQAEADGPEPRNGIPKKVGAD